MNAKPYVTHADLGGQAGFGRVVDADYDGVEPVFHHDWEKSVLAMTLAMGAAGEWNLDMSRSAREQLPGYLGMSYYEKWLGGLLRLLVERDLVRPEEVDHGHASHAARPVKRVLRAADVAAAIAAGSSAERVVDTPPRFSIGDAVRTRAQAVGHHTRLPAYARGKIGRVAAVRGAHVFPDSNSQGLGESPRWLYAVEFDARALWPEDGGAGHRVSIDAWEPYLEAA